MSYQVKRGIRSPNETSQKRCGPFEAPARRSAPGAFGLSISCSVPGTALSRKKRIPKWGSRSPARVCSKMVSPVEPHAESENDRAAGGPPGMTSGFDCAVVESSGRATAGQPTDRKRTAAATRALVRAWTFFASRYAAMGSLYDGRGANSSGAEMETATPEPGAAVSGDIRPALVQRRRRPVAPRRQVARLRRSGLDHARRRARLLQEPLDVVLQRGDPLGTGRAVRAALHVGVAGDGVAGAQRLVDLGGAITYYSDVQ